MNKRIEYDKNLAEVIDYGSAAALGVLGGVYSDEVANGLKAMTRWNVFRAPVNAVKSVYERFQGSAAKIGNWLGSKTATATEAVTESAPVTTTVEKSQNLFRRSIALWKTRGGRVPTREVVIRNIARTLRSPELSRGFTVTKVTGDELTGAKRLVFYKTGISGFRINQRRGSEYLTARIVNSQGEFEYYNVKGTAMRVLTRNGEEMVVPPRTMIGLLGERLRNFGTSTVSFVTATGRKIKTGITNSRAYQYASTNPTARRLVQGTAIGGSVGMLTLLALRPIDTSYLTIEDYVKDLSDQGIHIEDFVNGQRAQVQNAAGINNAAPLKAE